ncbi:nuclease-related domain-containing protein [Paenalkalicoccus suaedae]|uniref:nuclease-related domain-containing protein n=1 Tax=Paenalkalicoccus suaedae TaxID=2592382 RepID=UPI00158A75AF|nr:nuclease-related domain-containing protein [Paenalkalicoccus suaedae]
MVIKPRKTPVSFRHFDALIRRLEVRHPLVWQVQQDYDNAKAGFAGEESLDFQLSLLRPAEHYILHQVRLQVNEHVFEIDTLIVYSNMIVILEVKNFSGRLDFCDELGQLVQHRSKEEPRALRYPMSQLERQQLLLREWLAKHFPQKIEVHGFVVLVNRASIVQGGDLIDGLVRADKLPFVLNRLALVERKLRLEAVDQKRLAMKIAGACKEPYVDLVEWYAIESEYIRGGVYCSSCKSWHVERLRDRWCCKSCGHVDKDMHKEVLRDYQLLFGNVITCKEACRWLGLKKGTCLKLLKDISEPTSLSRKKVYYSLKSLT